MHNISPIYRAGSRSGLLTLSCAVFSCATLIGCSASRGPAAANSAVATTTTATSPATPTIVDATTTEPATTTTVEASTTTTTATVTTTIVEETTTTEPPTTTTTIVTAGAVVIVANATNLQGGATKLSGLLAKVGFQMGDATNSAGNEEFRDITVVYCLPGSEAVAGSVALLLGGVQVAYMPTPAPITGATAGLGNASVVVMLGRDLSGKTPPLLKNR